MVPQHHKNAAFFLAIIILTATNVIASTSSPTSAEAAKLRLEKLEQMRAILLQELEILGDTVANDNTNQKEVNSTDENNNNNNNSLNIEKNSPTPIASYQTGLLMMKQGIRIGHTKNQCHPCSRMAKITSFQHGISMKNSSKAAKSNNMGKKQSSHGEIDEALLEIPVSERVEKIENPLQVSTSSSPSSRSSSSSNVKPSSNVKTLSSKSQYTPRIASSRKMRKIRASKKKATATAVDAVSKSSIKHETSTASKATSSKTTTPKITAPASSTIVTSSVLKDDSSSTSQSKKTNQRRYRKDRMEAAIKAARMKVKQQQESFSSLETHITAASDENETLLDTSTLKITSKKKHEAKQPSKVEQNQPKSIPVALKRRSISSKKSAEKISSTTLTVIGVLVFAGVVLTANVVKFSSMPSTSRRRSLVPQSVFSNNWQSSSSFTAGLNLRTRRRCSQSLPM